MPDFVYAFLPNLVAIELMSFSLLLIYTQLSPYNTDYTASLHAIKTITTQYSTSDIVDIFGKNAIIFLLSYTTHSLCTQGIHTLELPYLTHHAAMLIKILPIMYYQTTLMLAYSRKNNSVITGINIEESSNHYTFERLSSQAITPHASIAHAIPIEESLNPHDRAIQPHMFEALSQRAIIPFISMACAIPCIDTLWHMIFYEMPLPKPLNTIIATLWQSTCMTLVYFIIQNPDARKNVQAPEINTLRHQHAMLYLSIPFLIANSLYVVSNTLHIPSPHVWTSLCTTLAAFYITAKLSDTITYQLDMHFLTQGDKALLHTAWHTATNKLSIYITRNTPKGPTQYIIDLLSLYKPIVRSITCKKNELPYYATITAGSLMAYTMIAGHFGDAPPLHAAPIIFATLSPYLLTIMRLHPALTYKNMAELLVSLQHNDIAYAPKDIRILQDNRAFRTPFLSLAASSTLHHAEQLLEHHLHHYTQPQRSSILYFFHQYILLFLSSEAQRRFPLMPRNESSRAAHFAHTPAFDPIHITQNPIQIMFNEHIKLAEFIPPHKALLENVTFVASIIGIICLLPIIYTLCIYSTHSTVFMHAFSSQWLPSLWAIAIASILSVMIALCIYDLCAAVWHFYDSYTTQITDICDNIEDFMPEFTSDDYITMYNQAQCIYTAHAALGTEEDILKIILKQFLYYCDMKNDAELGNTMYTLYEKMTYLNNIATYYYIIARNYAPYIAIITSITCIASAILSWPLLGWYSAICAILSTSSWYVCRLISLRPIELPTCSKQCNDILYNFMPTTHATVHNILYFYKNLQIMEEKLTYLFHYYENNSIQLIALTILPTIALLAWSISTSLFIPSISLVAPLLTMSCHILYYMLKAPCMKEPIMNTQSHESTLFTYTEEVTAEPQEHNDGFFNLPYSMTIPRNNG